LVRTTTLGGISTALRGVVIALVGFTLEVCFPLEAGERADAFLVCFTPLIFVAPVALFFEEKRLAEEILDLAPVLKTALEDVDLTALEEPTLARVGFEFLDADLGDFAFERVAFEALDGGRAVFALNVVAFEALDTDLGELAFNVLALGLFDRGLSAFDASPFAVLDTALESFEFEVERPAVFIDFSTVLGAASSLAIEAGSCATAAAFVALASAIALPFAAASLKISGFKAIRFAQSQRFARK
jgi:hypothetical protein